MFKRVLDIILSLLGLLLVWPLMLIISILIIVMLGAPVFFVQARPGRHGKLFKVYKFRSMKHEVNHAGVPLSDADRLTGFGSLLRASSLDELPELWNVLKGDMSMVGPRPLLIEYLPLYNAQQRRRHEVRPGITGWAQVNGRNELDWNRRFEFDVWYIDNQSLWLDLKIIFLTFSKVLKREGINQRGQATMERFKG